MEGIFDVIVEYPIIRKMEADTVKMEIAQLKDLSDCNVVIYFLGKDDITKLGVWEQRGFLEKLYRQKEKLCAEQEITTGFIDFQGNLVKVIVCGLGETASFSANILRKAAGNAVRYIDNTINNRVAVVAPMVSNNETLGAMVEGLMLGAYKFTECKSEKTAKNRLEYIFTVKVNDGEKIIAEAALLAENICWVRDLVNRPANIVNPSVMADAAQKIAKDLNIECEILGKKELVKKGMGAILAVGQGSIHEPKLITLKYSGAGAGSPYTAYVGKGITFDSGGISLKPAADMGEMKDDMTGAAVVLGAIKTIAELKLPVNIMAVASCAENMPSGSAIRPGDVVVSASGKTIEIVNTDAEGRMVLADAVWYACQQGAAKVIDIATLTGACIIALGNVTASIVGNDDMLCSDIIAAGKKAGESYWQLPSLPELKERLKGDTGDLLNCAGRPGDAITGGLFIGEFITNNIPWAHLDIGGTATMQKTDGFWIKGATGMGVATLVALARENK